MKHRSLFGLILVPLAMWMGSGCSSSDAGADASSIGADAGPDGAGSGAGTVGSDAGPDGSSSNPNPFAGLTISQDFLGSVTGHLSMSNGAVVLGSQGTPLNGGTVQVAMDVSTPVTTAADGSFRLDGVIAGPRSLGVTSGQTTTSFPITVVAGAAISIDPPAVSRDAAVSAAKSLSTPDVATAQNLTILASHNPIPAGVSVGSANATTPHDPASVALPAAAWLVYVDPTPEA